MSRVYIFDKSKGRQAFISCRGCQGDLLFPLFSVFGSGILTGYLYPSRASYIAFGGVHACLHLYSTDFARHLYALGAGANLTDSRLCDT